MKRNKEILRKELNDIKKRFLENLNQFRQTYGMLIEEEKNDKASELEYKFYKITKPALIKQKKDECKKARDKYLLNKQKVSSLHNDLANINKAYKTAISKFKLEYKTLLKIGNNDKTREFKHKFYTVIKPALIKQKKCDCKITKQK
jgi:uncharacterized protein with ParB-like and HNH nuclease domain